MNMQRITPFLLILALAGCSSRDKDLDNFIKTTKQEQPGGIEPLPEVKPYDSFKYDGTGLRSPFAPFAVASTVRPKTNRNKEFLEQFPLDQLMMAGTMTIPAKGGKVYGLVKTKDNSTVQRVLPGNYLGQNEGRVTKVEPSRITIVEIVPDQMGGYMERPATLTLTE